MIKIDGLPAKSELKNSQPKPTISSVTTPKKMIDLSKPSLVNEIVSKFNELPKLSNKNIITNKKEKCELTNQSELSVGKLVKLDGKLKKKVFSNSNL